jgi:hypothetical protein
MDIQVNDSYLLILKNSLLIFFYIITLDTLIYMGTSTVWICSRAARTETSTASAVAATAAASRTPGVLFVVVNSFMFNINLVNVQVFNSTTIQPLFSPLIFWYH